MSDRRHAGTAHSPAVQAVRPNLGLVQFGTPISDRRETLPDDQRYRLSSWFPPSPLDERAQAAEDSSTGEAAGDERCRTRLAVPLDRIARTGGGAGRGVFGHGAAGAAGPPDGLDGDGVA